MVPPSRRRRLSAYAVPALALVAVGFVAAGVQLGDGAVPIGAPRSRAPVATALSRPAAQITAESSRSDGVDVELAAALGAIGDLASISRAGPRPVDDSPAAPGALPAPLRSPQPAPAPGTSPSPPGSGEPPGDEVGLLDPPPAAGELVEEVLASIIDLTAPVVAPVTETTDPLLAPLGPILP
jgi:hypothetical protein